MAQGDVLMRKAFIEMQKEKPDFRFAFELLTKASKKGNSEALYAIGTWYLHGTFVKKAPKLAVDYFLKSIGGNHCNAYYDLAVCYEEGVGIKKDYKRAFECYLNAALLGDKQSLYEIGRCYYYGVGIPKNIPVAEVWLKHAEINGIN
jgi:uncharacterized protein